MTKMHKDARRFENEIAADLGGRRIALSGAGFEKADVRVRGTYKMVEGAVTASETLRFRVEAKTTSRSTYQFKAQDWLDLQKAAVSGGELPVFAICFYTKDRAPPKFVVITADLAQEFMPFAGLLIHKANRNYTMDECKLRNHRQARTFSMEGVKPVLRIEHYDLFITAVREYNEHHGTT